MALLAAVGVLIAALATPANAAPGDDPDGPDKPTLREQLDAAARGYIEAKARYDASKALEVTLRDQVQTTKLHLDLLTEQISEVAALSYRNGRLGVASALLRSASPDDFLNRAVSVEAIALYGDTQMRELRTLRRQLAQQQDRLYAELHKQGEELAAMEKRKKDAEKALAAAGGGRASGGFVSGNSPAAKPAPRNPDGSWPAERCTVDDPTTNGCLTPRTYHAYQQTRAAGFTRYVKCYRTGSSGEHPKGRACDWAAQPNGFGGTATGGDKAYGDRLASWYVANANALAVMYVIWYRQIWMPGLGWRSYRGGGDPASDHTNHVHLSVY